MRTFRTAALVILALAASASARAQSVDGAIAEAVSAAKSGQVENAGKAFGRAAALAHKSNDLLAEQRVADAMLEALGGTDNATVLAAVLSGLDPKRAGAFVSAGALAAELLMRATEAGNAEHAGEASKVLAAQAALPKCGKAARAFAAYGKALETIASTKGTADVAGILEGALKTAVEEGWIDLASHAGTELAAQSHKAGNDAKAKAALASVGSLFTPKTDRDQVQRWRALVNARLEGAPAEVLEPFETAMKPFAGSTSATGAGGAGGAGGSPSGTKIGQAWGKLSPAQAFVSVKRVDDGFEITGAFDPALKARQPLGAGLKHLAEGGVTLSFHGRGVALRMLDLQGGRGQPGETSFLPPGAPLYRLARGETWTVSKNGVVTIAGG